MTNRIQKIKPPLLYALAVILVIVSSFFIGKNGWFHGIFLGLGILVFLTAVFNYFKS